MTANFPAQSARARPDKRRLAAHALSVLLVCVSPMAAGPAGAQEGSAAGAETGQRPNWVITPLLSVDGTYTDNVSLAPKKKTDFITRIIPGITLDGQSARASASLNYQWQRYTYAENSGLGNNQRSLSARGQLELVEQWLFLEGSHNISQQTVSAFGTQGIGNELINSNRSETAGYSISPYIKGHLGSVADYQLRYSGTQTRSDSGALSGGTATTTRSWTGQLAGATPLAPLGWSLNADQQVIRNPNGVDSRSENASAALTFQIDPQVRMLVRAGRESDNFTNAVTQKRTTSGVGLDWAPTERTSISLKKDRNAAGKASSFDFSHRTSLSAWKFSQSRDITVPTPQMAQARTGTAYDLLYLQLASSFPDPAARKLETSRQLARAGIAADTPIFGALMTSQAFIQKRQQASVALMGANNTVIFAADRSSSERIGAGIGLADDFAQNTDIRQSGFNVNWAHKMTPDAALTLTASNSRTTGSANLETRLKAWSLMLTTQLGAKTSASIGLRQSRFASTAGTGYDEQALTGAIQIKF